MIVVRSPHKLLRAGTKAGRGKQGGQNHTLLQYHSNVLFCSVPQCQSTTSEVNREDKTNHLGGTTLSSGQRTQIQTQMHNCYENDLVKGSEAKDIRLTDLQPQYALQGGRTWQSFVGGKMAMKIFVKRVFTIVAINASFLRVSTNFANLTQ